MNRVISVFFVIMVLFFGVGTFVYAQNCPNIGDTIANGGAAWDGESERIAVCYSKGAVETPTTPSGVTFARRWKKTITTYYQEPGSCEFFAYRTVTEQKDDPVLLNHPVGWYAPDPPENTWFTGTITNNGKKIVMQAAPGPNNPSYTVFGKITKLTKNKKTATEITFTSSASTGDSAPGDIAEPYPFNRCSTTSWGTGSR